MQAIGFDMDYTLAQYRVETFEALAHKQTVDKLVGIGSVGSLSRLNLLFLEVRGIIGGLQYGTMPPAPRSRCCYYEVLPISLL